MSDFDDFMALDENVPTVKAYKPRTSKKQTFVCMVCRRVQKPTSERNIRCEHCNTPILKSLEKISTIQKDIKRYYLYPETLQKLKALLQETRELKKAYYVALEAAAYNRKMAEEAPKPKSQPQQPKVLVFHMVIYAGEVAMYPNGFTGNIEVPQDMSFAFIKKCKKLIEKKKMTLRLVGTVQERAVMEDIRQLMMEQQEKKR